MAYYIHKHFQLLEGKVVQGCAAGGTQMLSSVQLVLTLRQYVESNDKLGCHLVNIRMHKRIRQSPV